MKQALLSLYLNPTHWGYRCLENARLNWLKISLFCLAILWVYPIWLNIQAYQAQQRLQMHLHEKQEHLHQQTKLLTSLQAHQKAKNQQDSQLAKLNQQIGTLVEKQKAKIETLQWRFEQGKQLELVLYQKSNKMFPLIEQLYAINALHFKKMALIKLNRQHLIQLNADITLK